MEESTKNETTEDDASDTDTTDVYKLAIAQYNINPYAADS